MIGNRELTIEQRMKQNAPQPAHQPLRIWQVLRQVGFWALIIGIIIFTMFPFYWAFISSLKTEQEIISPATWFPVNPTTMNYEAIFTNNQFIASFINSAIVSTISVIVALVVGAFAAYALGRLQFRGRTVMLYLVLSMTMFPQISILSGIFEIVQSSGTYGSIASLILTYPLLTLPFTVWTLNSFFKGLPSELEAAAYVDGATPFQTFYMILLPLTAPALVTTGLLAFISAWNEYLFALTFTVINMQARTVTVAIAQFTGEVARQEPIAEVMAAAIVVTIPLILLVLVFQRRIVAGLTAGAVKG